MAASTPKGALVHRMIRTGRSLFTAHTNADSANPGVSDALAAALGLDVEAALEPATGAPDLDKWVIYVPNENAEAVQAAVFDAGAGHIGDYSHCSWTVTGIGQFLPHEGASPAVGSVGNVERVPEDRFEVVAPARARAAVLAALRAAHPYEEPAFDIFAMVPPPGDAGLGRVGTLTRPEPLRDFVSRVHAALPRTSWGCGPRVTPTCRCRGSPSAAAPEIRCWPPRPAPGCRPTSRPICGTTPPTSTAAPRTWP